MSHAWLDWLLFGVVLLVVGWLGWRLFRRPRAWPASALWTACDECEEMAAEVECQTHRLKLCHWCMRLHDDGTTCSYRPLLPRRVA